MASMMTRKQIIVCGLQTNNVRIDSYVEMLDTATWEDPLSRISNRYWYKAEFRFEKISADEIEIARQRFPVGSGTSFQSHDLGPADVCEYCGSAWLPGTLFCPSCAGKTSHWSRAIEYATRNPGRIMETNLDVPLTGIAMFTVRVEFAKLTWPIDGIEEMFRHSLWSQNPALWVCSFCGHMVYGERADCPGCSGKRRVIDKLATEYRECLWCGRKTMGGYACPQCNQRLKAAEKQPHWTL